MQIAIFGIDNDALNLTVNLLVLFLVVVWLALVAWTYFDARRRVEDQILVWCSVGASLFPFVGTIVYTILRPPEFIEDRKERDLEIRAAQLRVRQLTEQSCPNCGHPVEKSYLRCPECQTRIKDPCPSCEKPIDPRWAMCPYCETPIHREQPRRRGSERRPRREPERKERSKPSSQRSAPSKSAAPKREKRPAAEPARRKAGSTSSRRSTSARAAKAEGAPDPDATQEHPAPTDGADERSKPATKS